jgi:hypothetical protein
MMARGSMKLLVVFLLSCAALFAQPPVPGTSVHNTSSCLSVATCSTAAQTHAAGTFLLARYGNNTSSTVTITNTCGDTWVPITPVGNGSLGFVGAAYVLSSVGCSNDVVTATVGSPVAALEITVIPITGTAPNFPIDVGSSGHAVGGTDSSTTTLTTNPFTTRTANQLIFAIGYNVNAPVYTAGSGYTLIDTSVDNRMAVEYKSVTSTQTGATAQMSATIAGPPWLGDVISISSTDLPAPAWSITKSHSGSFTQGDFGDTYTIIVTNSGSAPTDGTPVMMTETIPSQMGVVSMTGTGWSCSFTVCTTLGILAPSASYPAITVKVYVGSTATSPKVNSVNVVGGGSAPTPVSTTDSTTILSGPSTITLTANPNFQWTGSGLTWATSIRQSGHISFPLEIDVSGAGTITVGSCSSGNSCPDIYSKLCTPGVNPCSPAITAATNANPPVFTIFQNTNIAAGDSVIISGFGGSWAAENGTCVASATALTTTTFECATLNGGAVPDATTFGAISGKPIIYDTTVRAPATVFLGMDLENNPSGYNPGSHTASYPITGSGGGSGTVNLTWTSVAYTNPSFTSYSGTITNCTAGGNWPNPGDTNICTFTTGQAYDVFTPPAPVGTYVDGNFGGVVKTLVAPPTPGNPERLMGGDSVTGQINSDNSLVITNIVTGFQFATSTSTGADVYSNFTFCSAAFTWDPTQPLVHYWLNGTSVMKHTHPNNCSADTTVATYPGLATGGVTNGGDGGVNKLKFWALYTSGSDPSHPFVGNDQTVMIVDLNTGSIYTGSYAGKFVEASGNNARNVVISKGVDAVTHKMYALLGAYPNAAAEVYSLQFASDNVTVTGSALVDEGSLGMTEHAFLPGYLGTIQIGPNCSIAGNTANECYSVTHSDTFEGGDGQEYYLGLAGVTGSNFLTGYSVAVAMRFSSCITGVTCAPMLVDVEGGGGGVETFNVCVLGDCGDIHEGCAVKAPVCIVGTDADPSVTETDITNAVTSGGNVNLTLAGTPSFITGATVTVGGVNGNGTSTGCLRANGVWTNVTVSGTTVTLNGVTCDGSWVAPPITAGSGIVPTFQTANPGSHQDELMLFDFTNIASKQVKVKRLVKSRAVTYNPGPWDSYYTQNHPVISMFGDLVIWGANDNRPYSLGIFSTPTGYTPGPRFSSQIGGKGQFGGNGRIR